MNNQQKFLSELVELCTKHNVVMSGTITVWPADADERRADAILADVEHVGPDGLFVGQRSARHMPKPWGQGMAEAYDAGLEDGLAGKACPRKAEGFDACYWQGFTHGTNKRESL